MVMSETALLLVDLQNDSTAADLKLALREGYSSIEHAKRYTTTGMATDQGKSRWAEKTCTTPPSASPP